MCKRFGLGAMLTVLGLFAVYKAAGLDSYAGTAWSKVSSSVKREVPLEFEIDRVRHEVSRIVPEIKKQYTALAEEIVAVDRLKEEIVVTRANLQRQKDVILAMKKDLESGDSTVSYDGRTFSASRVREKLTRDFDLYKRCETELKTREQLLDAREKSLEAAREQLAAMKVQKQELEVRVAQLEAKLKTVRLAQTRNRFQLDEGQLARCKAALAQLETRLDVEATKEALAGDLVSDPIPVEKKKPAAELTKEIDSYFTAPAKIAGAN